jgi:hypothetical protein
VTVLVTGGVGRFPPWRDAYPAGRPARVSFDPDQARCLSRVAEVSAEFAGDSGPAILNATGGTIRVSTSDRKDAGWGGDSDVTAACTCDGNTGLLSVRGADLHRCLSWIGAGPVDLLFWGPGQPVVLRRENGPEYLLAAWAGESGG